MNQEGLKTELTTVLPTAIFGTVPGVLRLAAVFLPPLRAITPGLGRRRAYSSVKAQRLLGFQPRPTRETVIDTGLSLYEKGVLKEG